MKKVSFSKTLLLTASVLFLAAACQPNSQQTPQSPQAQTQTQSQPQTSAKMPEGSCPKEKPAECKKPCGSCDKPCDKPKECPKPCGEKPCKQPSCKPCEKSCSDAPKPEQPAVPAEAKKSEQACSEVCPPAEKESALVVVAGE